MLLVPDDLPKSDAVAVFVNIASALVTGLVAYLVVLIKLSQSKNAEIQSAAHAQLLAHQVEVQKDLTASDAKLAQELAVHTMEDAQRFRRIDERFDDVLDSLNEVKQQAARRAN
jgi:hypothetical protein